MAQLNNTYQAVVSKLELMQEYFGYLKKENLQTPDDYQGTFEIMARCSALPSELAFAMAPSVGLRNALVHVYEKNDSRSIR